jgi:short-subunit dehydrogenase
VTGASSGIGEELARLAAADGCDLILVSRRQERLEALARELSVAHGISASVIAEDLADPQAPARIVEEIEREKMSVDVLVNNAGLGVYGRFVRTHLQRQLEVIQINVAALTELTGRILPGMVARRRGRILNVASMAAFQPGPYMSVYYATKAYVLSFSEALAEELRKTGVTVTALCPGPTTTEFQKRSGIEGDMLLPAPFVMDAASVAKAGWSGTKRGKRVVVPGAANKILKETVRFSPRRLVTKAAGRLQKRRSGKKG